MAVVVCVWVTRRVWWRGCYSRESYDAGAMVPYYSVVTTTNDDEYVWASCQRPPNIITAIRSAAANPQ